MASVTSELYFEFYLVVCIKLLLRVGILNPAYVAVFALRMLLRSCLLHHTMPLFKRSQEKHSSHILLLKNVVLLLNMVLKSY